MPEVNVKGQGSLIKVSQSVVRWNPAKGERNNSFVELLLSPVAWKTEEMGVLSSGGRDKKCSRQRADGQKVQDNRVESMRLIRMRREGRNRQAGGI